MSEPLTDEKLREAVADAIFDRAVMNLPYFYNINYITTDVVRTFLYMHKRDLAKAALAQQKGE